MNKNKLKTYAPKARRDFIAAVTARAAKFGITQKSIAPAEEQGELVVIGGEAFPRKIGQQRQRLVNRVQRQSFTQVMEEMAYTWFNRFAAIRYMELHGYLDHGYRVLSHPQGHDHPEVLEHAEHLDFGGLDRDRVIDLKLDGTKDAELYRLLLIAQCNALHQALPFLFERVDDETELLLPDNLLQTDSLIRELVREIPEEDWQEVEIIGWLYQFYISEKKDQVIGKVVKSEDIPAATQLFTPNWIVKYMVQNSLGAQWLATYPDSALKDQMEYYIEPAEQTDEVKQQLKEITPSSLNPEEITLMDPACGSGHILVEAYDLFKAIYLERGYRQRDIPQLILTKNLFGLDIDQRAAQLAGFSLLMKGRADDRRLFERGVRLHIMALLNSADFDADRLIQDMELVDYRLHTNDLTELKLLFEHATTFGSLIQVPERLTVKLSSLNKLSKTTEQDLFLTDALGHLGKLVQQTELLGTQYDAVVANPPYMGSGGMNSLLKKFTKDNFTHGKNDLFACFIERGFTLAKHTGQSAMITMETWMFLSGYEKFRQTFLREHTLKSLVHLPYDGKRPTAMGINFGVAIVTTKRNHVSGYLGHFCCSRYYELNDDGVPFQFPTKNERLNTVSTDEFSIIPGSSIAYWLPHFRVFHLPPLSGLAKSGGRTKTHNDAKYVRNFWEVDQRLLGRDKKWIFFEKGGQFRRWSGDSIFVVEWTTESRNSYAKHGGLSNKEFWQKRGVTWPTLTSGINSFKLKSLDAEYSSVSPTIFFRNEMDLGRCLALLNSRPVGWLIGILNPTLALNPGDVLRLPIPSTESFQTGDTRRLVDMASADWSAYESSFEFKSHPILRKPNHLCFSLESSYITWIEQNSKIIVEMKRLEEENNRFFINAYGLQNELTPEVSVEQITLTVNPAYRYGGNLTEDERWDRFREDTMKELVSYAIGCMMGRYSLDEPGLIYAHSGNEGFDSSRYTTFPADEDGIVPITDAEWFDDDACNRVAEFISVAWDAAHLEENLTFLANNLGPKKNETGRDTIRRYLSQGFFKDHQQTYKKRPIYWLFSSGKQRAFECLVYLHRYNEGTLSRMRMEYVTPLQSRMSARIETLDGDIGAAGSTTQRNRKQKEKDRLVKQLEELRKFDEKLRHYADQRIALDLDDGVKVNYGKFGNLLAEVKAVTGKKPS